MLLCRNVSNCIVFDTPRIKHFRKLKPFNYCMWSFENGFKLLFSNYCENSKTNYFYTVKQLTDSKTEQVSKVGNKMKTINFYITVGNGRLHLKYKLLMVFLAITLHILLIIEISQDPVNENLIIRIRKASGCRYPYEDERHD